MNQAEMEQLLRNVDQRLARVERILPTLATKQELSDQGSELRAVIRAEAERTRRHFDVVAESLHDDSRLLAEGQASLAQRLESVRTDLKKDIAVLDRRFLKIEASQDSTSQG